MNIKGFDKELKCRGMQFEVGKEYKIEGNKPLELCTDTVFHYCKSLSKVHGFYAVDQSRFCEIEVLGEEITDGEKCGSNHIRILREITGDELDKIAGRVNGNAGVFNSGNCNSGNWNSGHWNSGDCNSRNCNSGNWNSGNWNSGDWNSGDCNSGNRNSGNCNSGNWNSGDCNSGNCNSGNCNSGNFNSCSYSSGIFCNRFEESIRIFNRPSGMTHSEFYESKYWKAVMSAPLIMTGWIEDESKTEGGYLKTYSYKDACRAWWNRLTDENKEIIKSMPNFDVEVFEDITGIKV